MQLINRVVSSDFNLFLFGDAHLGTVLNHATGFEKFIDTIQSPYEGLKASRNIGVDHGDAIEAISIDDKRYEPTLVKDPRGTPFDQANDYVKLMKPIREKIVTILEGNHERKIRSTVNLSKYIATELGIPWGTFTAKIAYRDYKGNLLFKHYAMHGRKMINSIVEGEELRQAKMAETLKKQIKNKAADCTLMSKAHIHKLIIKKPENNLFLTDDGEDIHHNYTGFNMANNRGSKHKVNFIHPDYRWYCTTGSFLKQFALGESGYAERAEYDPVELGFLVGVVRGGQIMKINKEVL